MSWATSRATHVLFLSSSVSPSVSKVPGNFQLKIINMLPTTLLILCAAAAVSALPHWPQPPRRLLANGTDTNPFAGKKLFANPTWATKLNTTLNAFVEQGDEENAAKVKAIQDIGTFGEYKQIHGRWGPTICEIT